MSHKPHHKRHRRLPERSRALLLAGFLLVVVLALLAMFLWWVNSPKHGSV